MTRSKQGRRFSTTASLTVLFGAVAILYLLVAHPQHVLGILPVVVLLACPLMHLVMHGGGHTHC